MFNRRLFLTVATAAPAAALIANAKHRPNPDFTFITLPPQASTSNARSIPGSRPTAMSAAERVTISSGTNPASGSCPCG